MYNPTVVSLFSGAGGFDLGLEQAGAKIIWACDNFKDAVNTYRMNFKDVIIVKDDIRTISSFPNADIIIGGYPCQGFSIAGKRLISDERNFLYKEFVRALSQVRPKFFIAENVKGLLSIGNGKIIEAMVNEFAEQGYNVKYKLFNAKNVGVPQDRERVFIVGVRKDINYEYEFMEETHGEGKLPYVTLRDTIYGLPFDPVNEYPTYGFSSRYMSRNRKRGWDEVSFCIQASGRHAPLHPHGLPMIKIDKDIWRFDGDFNRRLSFREVALIQTFPIDFQFSGNLENKYKQIGNAVPPLLAKFIATPIIQFFNT